MAVARMPSVAVAGKTATPKPYEVPLALLCYCVSSISMTLMNKYVLSSHKFKMNFLLLTLQVNFILLFVLIYI